MPERRNPEISPLDPEVLHGRTMDAPGADERSRVLDERYAQIRAILYGSDRDNGRVLRTEEKVTAMTLSRHWSEWQISGESASKGQLHAFSARSKELISAHQEREGIDLLDEKGQKLLSALAYHPLWQILDHQQEVEERRWPPTEASGVFQEVRAGILTHRDQILGNLATEATLAHDK